MPVHSDKPEDPERTEWYAKLAKNLAQKVHKHLTAITKAKVDFPSDYTAETREILIEQFKAVSSKH